MFAKYASAGPSAIELDTVDYRFTVVRSISRQNHKILLWSYHVAIVCAARAVRAARLFFLT